MSARLIFWLSRGKRIRSKALLKLSFPYQILVALTISLVTHLPSWEVVVHSWSFSGVAFWIIVFAVLIPSSPRRVLVISSLSALMDPAGLLVTHLLGAPLPSFGFATMLFVPTGLSVGMAVACSVVIHRLGRDIEQAREFGSYELVEFLGKGGMGEVWRARHRLLTRPAAIKLIRSGMLSGDDTSGLGAQISRFEREAKTTASLESQHTVTLYDFGVASDGSLYYVMELLQGMDLENLVESFGPVTSARAVYLLQQVCHSLEEAHQRELIHRDIKPANIFVAKKGLEHDFVKVLDFGLVKRVTTTFDDSETRLTAEGSITGTPDYIAPEVAGGDDIDARSDIYCLGCVAYFVLCGETVFGVDKPIRTLVKHISEEPRPLSSRAKQSIPKELEALVHRCLAKAPEDRPSSVKEVRQQLDAIELQERWSSELAGQWWVENVPENRGESPLEVLADSDTLVYTKGDEIRYAKGAFREEARQS